MRWSKLTSRRRERARARMREGRRVRLSGTPP
jgi:hypothetical protein